MHPLIIPPNAPKTPPRILAGATTGLRYNFHCAVVVVEGATLATFVTGATTMIITGIVLNIAGLGMLCWAMFRIAVYALPFFVGMMAGISALLTGAGPFGAIVVGIIFGAFALVAGQLAFSVARSAAFRLVVGLLFALPAAVAGYQLSLGFAHLGIVSEGWRQVFALIGAVTVGGSAWTRMGMLVAPLPIEGVHASSPQPPLESVTTSV
ncbi:hypothetical protein [Rhodopseudomonas palustris]|uniref:hypothetical protein n=1 Tax=Rhodopseudomonas palustris TaxID=1076 RepID=UPI0039F63891